MIETLCSRGGRVGDILGEAETTLSGADMSSISSTSPRDFVQGIAARKRHEANPWGVSEDSTRRCPFGSSGGKVGRGPIARGPGYGFAGRRHGGWAEP